MWLNWSEVKNKKKYYKINNLYIFANELLDKLSKYKM